MLKKVLGVISLSTLSLFATSDCKVDLTTSAYINWNAINASKNIGLYDKVEKEYNCKLNITYYPDYLQSINSYVSGKQDAVTITNLDAMTAIGSSVPSTHIVLQDYSNGNDGLISRNGKSLKEIKGQDIWMVTKSVSELLFVEASKKEGLDPYKDFVIKHMDADSDLRAAFDTGNINNIVTWNPALNYLESQTKLKKSLVTSEKFPGLIVDTIVMNNTIKDFDHKSKFVQALWNETTKLLTNTSSKEYSEFISSLSNEIGATQDETKLMLNGSKVFTQKESKEFLNTLYDTQLKIYNIALENEFLQPDVKINVNINGKVIGDKSIPTSINFKID